MLKIQSLLRSFVVWWIWVGKSGVGKIVVGEFDGVVVFGGAGEQGAEEWGKEVR